MTLQLPYQEVSQQLYGAKPTMPQRETKDRHSFICTCIHIKLNRNFLYLPGGETDTSHTWWVGGTDAVTEGEWFWAKIVQPFEVSFLSLMNKMVGCRMLSQTSPLTQNL